MRFFLLALAMGLGGCATLIHGSSQSVRVESDSSGARVEVDGRPVGETPTTVQLERNQNHRVRVFREGQEPHTVRTQQGRSIWAAVNLLNLIVPGVLVDLSTGAFYSVSPDPIQATFDASTSPAADSSQSDP